MAVRNRYGCCPCLHTINKVGKTKRGFGSVREPRYLQERRGVPEAEKEINSQLGITAIPEAPSKLTS